MQISLSGIGKRFNNEWIFRNIDFTFPEGSASAILGRNGSGKSTLLQILAGNMVPSAGNVAYLHEGKQIAPEEIFRFLVMATPYLELIEDFTLREMIDFHFSFKGLRKGMKKNDIYPVLGFGNTGSKHINQFSSGMKQRVKLALALLSEVPLVLLDEPTMNLDQEGIAWYHELLRLHGGQRTLVICSNLHQTESSFAGQVIRVEDYKK